MLKFGRETTVRKTQFRSGRAMAGMLSTFAEFERDIIRNRVKAGIANAREKGKAHSRSQTTQSSCP